MKIIVMFTVGENEINDAFDWIIISSYVIYMCLNFCQTYIDENTGEEISDNKLMAIKYLKGWFTIDFLSTFPWELIPGLKDKPYLRLIRLIRLNKIYLFFTFIERVHLKMRYFVSLLRLVFFGIFGTFFFACLWYIVSKHFTNKDGDYFIKHYKLHEKNGPVPEEEQKSIFYTLVACFFFSLTTLTTTGFGDYIGYNIPERILATLYMTLGILYFSFLVSLLFEEIKIIGDDNETVEAQKLLKDYRKYHQGKNNQKFSREIQHQLLQDVNYATKHMRYEDVTKKENFDILPESLKNELSNYLWRDVFTQLYDYYDLFEGDKVLLNLLCNLSYSFVFKYYHLKETIYYINKEVEEINIIQSGYADVINYKAMLRKRLTPGDAMGMFYILYDVRPIYVYSAASSLEVVTINKGNFLSVLNKYEYKYTRKLKQICMVRFREIFNNINNSNNHNIKKDDTIFDKKNEKDDITIKNSSLEVEKDYVNLRKKFNEIIYSENNFMKNIYYNESINDEYKQSFKFEKLLINKIKHKNII